MKDTLDSYSEDQPAKVGRRKSLKLSAAGKLFLNRVLYLFIS